MLTDDEGLDLISRYLNNPSDPRIRADVADFRSRSPENEALFLEMERAWELSARTRRLDLIDPKQSARRLKLTIQDSLPPRRWTLRRFAAVAASLVVIGGLMWLTLPGPPPVVVTRKAPAGTIDSVKLSDGSLVVLSGGATLRYPQKFSDKGRRLTLVEGMALFVVKRDESRPFRIAVDSSEVRVLGTSFNISSTKKSIQVSVRSGKVLFAAAGAREGLALTAGQALTLNRSTETVTTMESRNADAWLTRKLVFVDAPLEEVCLQLSEYYQQDISLINKNPQTVRQLNATFHGEPLEQVLKLIQETYPVRIKKANNRTTLISY